MGYANYVGRVGGLAVALGVGVAVATTPGVAWAGPSDSGSSSSTSDSKSSGSPSGSNGGSGSNEGAASESPGESGGEDAGLGAVGNEKNAGEDASSGSDDSGGNKKSTESTVTDKKSGSDYSAAAATPKKPKRSVASTPSGGDISKSEPAEYTNAAVQPKSQPVSAPPATSDVSVVEVASVTALTRKTSLDQPRVVSERELVDKPLSSTLLSAVGLAPSADGDVPQVPGDSPLLLAGLAAFRRQTQQSLVGDESPALKVAEPSQSSLMMAAAVANSAPTVDPSQGVPDQASGAIAVNLNAVDPDGNSLTYTATGQPANGSLTVTSPGQYRYTPTQAARLAAGSTSVVDFDSFTVSVSDGQGGVTPVTVSVAVLPSVISAPATTTTGVGITPMGVAVSATKTYVANQGSNTVTVFDRSNPNAAPVTINVVGAPTAIALSSDGQAYVAGNNGVSVINTATNQVIATVTTNGGQSYGIAVAPNGQRVYVTMTGTNRVAMINTNITANTYTLGPTVAVGTTPGGITLNADGSRAYVANWNSGSLTVLDTSTATPTLASTITVGANPFGVALSPNGQRVYVSNFGSGTVSMITIPATGSPTVSPIAVGINPFGLTMSHDGSLVYAVNGNDTVSVIDTKSNTVVRNITIDSQAENQWHSVALSPDGGQIYVSDLADRAMRILTINRGNTAPVITGNSTPGSPNLTNGAVSGPLDVKDYDGDTLTHSVAQPSNGTVTITGGIYTFVPTQTARDAAAGTPGPDEATFTVTARAGRGASTPINVKVPISPTPVGNRAPQAGTPSIDNRDRVTGAVSGNLNFTDPDNNPLTYGVPSQPASGTVTFIGSTYTFTPTAVARNAAASGGATSVNVTVAASDGQLSTPVTWSVPIIPPNRAPTAGTPSVENLNTTTGAVSGNLNFSDLDNDSLTYSVPTPPASGTVTFNGSTYTYKPNQAARNAAAAGGATSASITVVADDGLATSTVTWSVPISPTPPPNSAPVAFETTVINTDAATGTVLGKMKVIDPEDNPLTYTVTTGASKGTASVDAAGVFVYTPTQAARLQAAVTPSSDTFTVTISDGLASITKVVNVTVSPAVVTAPSTTQAGTSPMGVVVTSTKTYVANQGSNTVTVFDRTNPTATPVTINVVAAPTAIALSSDGRAYVAGNGSVSVINTATNQVITTVSTNGGGQSYGIAVAPNGQRVYVTMTGTNRVAVINANTAANTYTLGPTVAVGSTPAGIALNGDGSRAYVANWNSGTVSVLDTSATTPTVIRPITVGASPFGVAVNADASRVYVSNYGSNSVSVLNPTATTPLVATIPVGTQPFGITLSPDRTVLYVANGNDTVSIIDTRSNAVIGTPVSIDTAPEINWHSIAVSPDGRQLYVSDLSDRVVRVLTVMKPTNQAPWVPGSTIPGGPDPVTGTVTGRMNVQDPDLDALTYALASPPGQGGTVTFDQQTGVFTYTPSQAARNLAAQTSGLDYDMFGVSITDGIATVYTTVTVQVAPTLPPTVPTTNAAVTTGTGPSGAAISNDFAYVINYESNNVTVINTATNQVVKTIAVGAGPLSVAAIDTPQRKRVYVSNSLSNSVSVIDATTNTVLGTINIDVQPGYENNPWDEGTIEYPNRVTEMAASQDGTRLYVNATDGGVRVIDTSTNAVIRTAYLGTFSDLEVSPDGTRLFGAAGTGLTVINTATMTAVGVQVGNAWDHNAMRSEFTNGVGNVAVSPDGKRAYVTYGVTIVERGVGGQSSGYFISDAQGQNWMVTGGYSAISVIDTDPASANYNKEIARITVPLGAQDLTVSGNTLYVTNWDNKTVTTINTATNAAVGSFSTDQTSPGRGAIYLPSDDWPLYPIAVYSRYITVGSNGTIYVTDYADGKVYAVAPGSPSV